MQITSSGVGTRQWPLGGAVFSWPPPIGPEIRRFLANAQRIAVVGMEADPQSVEFLRAERLLAWGYQLFPVHSRCGDLLGNSCYDRLAEVPGPIDVLLVLPTNRVAQRDLAGEAIDKQIGVFWVEDARLDGGAAALLAANGIPAVEQRSLQFEVAQQR
jgi:predicted CoA-binding protein